MNNDNAPEQGDKNPPSGSLVVSQRYATSVSSAFEAWTDPEILTKWFGPPGYTAAVLQHDLRVTGSWKFRMTSPAGDHHHHYGTFIEITEYKRLVFTWASEEPVQGWRDNDNNPTIVTVDFSSVDGGVEITITHENLISNDAIQSLTYGWRGTLDCLSTYLG